MITYYKEFHGNWSFYIMRNTKTKKMKCHYCNFFSNHETVHCNNCREWIKSEYFGEYSGERLSKKEWEQEIFLEGLKSK